MGIQTMPRVIGKTQEDEARMGKIPTYSRYGTGG